MLDIPNPTSAAKNRSKDCLMQQDLIISQSQMTLKKKINLFSFNLYFPLNNKLWFFYKLMRRLFCRPRAVGWLVSKIWKCVWEAEVPGQLWSKTETKGCPHQCPARSVTQTALCLMSPCAKMPISILLGYPTQLFLCILKSKGIFPNFLDGWFLKRLLTKPMEKNTLMLKDKLCKPI